MFTLEEINNEVELFNKYTGYDVPQITEVLYDLTKEGSIGLVKQKEILNEMYCIHLNSNIHEFAIENQKAIVWHELTHVRDLLYYNNTVKDISSLMKTYSEVHAASIELKKLLGLNKNSIQMDLNQHLNYLGYYTKYEYVINYHTTCTLKSLEDFLSDKKPYDFNFGINSFMYLCGSCIIIKNGCKIVNEKIDLFPKTYQDDLRLMCVYAFSNNHEGLSSLYPKMLETAMLYSMPCDTNKSLNHK